MTEIFKFMSSLLLLTADNFPILQPRCARSHPAIERWRGDLGGPFKIRPFQL